MGEEVEIKHVIDLIKIESLDLHDGDILIVRVPAEYTARDCDMVHEAFARTFDRADIRATVVIGRKEVDLQIVRKAEAA